MIITLKSGIKKSQVEAITKNIKKFGLSPYVSHGAVKTIIGGIGANDNKYKEQIEALEGVESVTPILKPYKLVSREFRKENTVIDVKGTMIGGQQVVVMAGPCSVDTKENLLTCARAVKKSGAHF